MLVLLQQKQRRNLVLTKPNPPQEQLPSFIGIGVQKGGTTTLHQLLCQHPQVLMPERKELQYFSFNYHLGLPWYVDRWPAGSPLQKRGEISPYYIFHPYAAERIRAAVPEARLLILLRDPVERTLSQYFHSRRLGLEPLDLEAALAAEERRLEGAEATLADPNQRHHSHQEHSYLSRSRYELQLPLWEHHFPAEQMLVLRSEALFQQPSLVWEQLQTFLELPAIPFPIHAFGRIHAGKGEAAEVATAVRERIRQQLLPTYDFLSTRYQPPCA